MAVDKKILKYGEKKQYKKLYAIVRKGATYDTIDAVFEQLGNIKNRENFSQLCEMYQFKDPIVHLAVVKALCSCAGPENIEILRHYQNGEQDDECLEIMKARVLVLKIENDKLSAEKNKFI